MSKTLSVRQRQTSPPRGEKNLVILAIETSCDETAAAVLSLADNNNWPEISVLSSVVKSQISIHKSFGGVVPEAAARAHVKNILPVVQKALSTSHCPLSTINCIAITQGPGLIPSLIVGVEFAKALSLATGKPVIPVNHMLGHLYSPFGKIENLKLKTENLFPVISLIVSGGHTMIVLMKNVKEYKVLGQTVDDAAGEAFDKVAKLLGLPYPGGPAVSKLAKLSKSSAIQFPRPMINNKNYNFSFSGLKTAVLYYAQSLPATRLRQGSSGQASYNLQAKKDICKAFQDAAVDVLVTKTMRAVKKFGAKSISLSGGVAANEALRNSLNLKSKILNLNFFAPQKNLCTDNAEMIGLAACFMLHNGFKPKSFRHIKADPNLEL